MNRCKRCGRRISDPLSVKRGIGTSCWAKEHPKGRKVRTGRGKTAKKKRRAKAVHVWKQTEFLFKEMA